MSVPEQASLPASATGPPAGSAASRGRAVADRMVVVDASVVVDLLAGTELAAAVARRLSGTVLHAPAHCEAEVLSALGRLQRAGELTVEEVDAAVAAVAAMPLTRHPLTALLPGAWARRGRLRLLDALYVELASQLDIVVVTTDHRLARATDRAEAIVAADDR